MKNRILKNRIALILLPVFLVTSAFAQSVVNPPSITAPTATPIPSATTDPAAAAAAAAAQQQMAAEGAAAAAAAQAAAASMMAAMAASAVMAAVMATQCGPKNPMACVMAALAAAQAGLLGAEAASAGDSQAALQGAAPTYPTAALAMPTPVVGSTAGEASQLANGALATLAAQGVTLNPDGSVTLADGTTVPASAAGDTAAQSAAGFSAAQIAAGQASLADAQAQAKAKSKSILASLSADGGGGAGRGGSGGASVAIDFGKLKKAARAKPSLAGMSKNLGGDKIGVAGDNIFEMVTRRYKARDADNNFFRN
jgi:hypothetical protein